MLKLISFFLSFTFLTNTITYSYPAMSADSNYNGANTNVVLIASNNGQTQSGNVPAGTEFDTTLQRNISTGENQNNDQFQLKVKGSWFGKNKTLDGGVVQGHLEDIIKAAKGKKASLHLVFDDIQLKDGSIYPVDATLVNTQVETKTKGKFFKNAGIILGGAVAGHFLSNKAEFKHGGLAGSAAAAAFVLSSPGGEVVLKKGTTVKLKLKTALNVN